MLQDLPPITVGPSVVATGFSGISTGRTIFVYFFGVCDRMRLSRDRDRAEILGAVAVAEAVEESPLG